MRDLLIAFLGNADKAIAEFLLLVERAAGIDCTVDPVIATRAELDLAALFAGGAFGYQVDQAARLVLPEQDR
ncbi:hypothetical protein D3C81_2042990 [compost metagenome]